jgi:hypothetical protein
MDMETWGQKLGFSNILIKNILRYIKIC